MHYNPEKWGRELLCRRGGGECAAAGSQSWGNPCPHEARTCAVDQLPVLMLSMFSHQCKVNGHRKEAGSLLPCCRCTTPDVEGVI